MGWAGAWDKAKFRGYLGEALMNPRKSVSTLSADSPVPLSFGFSLLTGDDRYVMSCPVTTLVAARGRPSKLLHFSELLLRHRARVP